MGSILLPCYDIPGLPPDNLQLEAFFNQVRRHQRRISGRKSTRDLNRFGHYQVLFTAESEDELLDHLRQVPLEAYQAHRHQLQMAEKPQAILAPFTPGSRRYRAKISQQLHEPSKRATGRLMHCLDSKGPITPIYGRIKPLMS